MCSRVWLLLLPQAKVGACDETVGSLKARAMPKLEAVITAAPGTFDLSRQNIVGAHDGALQDTRPFKAVSEEAEGAWNMLQHVTNMEAVAGDQWLPDAALEV